MKTIVQISLTRNDLKKLPKEIIIKLQYAVELMQKSGIESLRKINGYNDEKLSGERSGQRSFRLNRSWRAIYEENITGEITLIDIVEVNKHKY